MTVPNLRQFVLLVAAFCIISHGLTTYLIVHLSHNINHIVFQLALYTGFATAASLLGFVGALLDHPATLHLFSHFLLLDAFVCAAPRYALVYLLSSFSQGICSSDFITPSWGSPANAQPLRRSLPLISPSPNDMYIYHPTPPQEYRTASCPRAVRVAALALAAGFAASSVTQGWVALVMRSESGRRMREEEEEGKIRLEDDDEEEVEEGEEEEARAGRGRGGRLSLS